MNSTDSPFQLPDFSFDPTAIFIYGGGGHGKTLIDLLRTLGVYRIVGLVDDHLPAGSTIMGLPVLGGTSILPELYGRGVRLAVNAIGGIGDVSVRLRVFDLLAKAGFSCPNLVHPGAWVETSAVLDGGVQVLAHAYVGTESRVGFGSVLNAHVVISHDCLIGQCVNLSPGALLAGDVWIGDFTQIGMGVTINLHVHIGARVRIGNGATVKAHVSDGGRVYAGHIWPPPKEHVKSPPVEED